MNRLTLSCLIACLPLGALATDFHANAPVVAAKLYTQEAEIIREARINIPEAGTHRILVSPILSANLGDLSVQLTGAKLIAQSSSPTFRDNENPIWEQIDDAENALALTDNALEDNTKLSSAIIKRAEQSEEDLASIQEKLTQLQTERAKLFITRDAQQKTFDTLKKRAEWLGRERDNVVQAAVFDIVAEQAGEVVLQLREQTSQSSWQPYSEFHLDSEKGVITVQAGAQIAQNTGLDWHNVALTLAITPLNYVERPSLQTTSVAIADRVVAASESAAMLRNPAPMMLKSPPVAEYAIATPVLLDNGLDFTVDLGRKYNLRSGSERYQIPYWQSTTPAEIYSAIYSWTQPQALVIGEWTQESGSGFIPGEVGIYRDGNRLASLYFGEMWTGGVKHVVSFGQDPQIEVDFHNPPNYTAGSGFIIKDKIHEQRDTITARNLSDQNKMVRIYSRIPVATQQEITIEGKFTPQPSQKDAENVKGIYMWEKALSPSETIKVESGYDIRYPEDKRLIGLD